MSLSSADVAFVSELVRQRSAIVLLPEKAYLLEARLAPIAQAEGFPSMESLVQHLRMQSSNGLHLKVVEAMTTNETSFFRDLYPFEALKTRVLPDLISRRSGERQLRIWCAACSSGQEPYTVAMILLDHFPEVANWDVKILGTDLSGKMVARSVRGRYGQIEVNRGLPANLLLRHFDKEGTEWVIKPGPRKMCEFREMNLIEPWEQLPPMDVILMRNVLIYFDLETKRAVLNQARRALQPWGYLFLGGAETTLNLGDTFERVDFERSACYRLKQS
ncbi:MAG TPA: protein-glutamate O-methyltransferase CheR [Gemmatimonadales bacterium]|nr:protein-glutamate O-methyltransferase CheR [Gemmatimonadales bacterium]